MTREELSLPVSGGAAVVTDIPSRDVGPSVAKEVWQQSRVAASSVKMQHVEI